MGKDQGLGLWGYEPQTTIGKNQIWGLATVNFKAVAAYRHTQNYVIKTNPP